MSGTRSIASSPDTVVVGAGLAGMTAAVSLAEAGRRVVVWAADDPRLVATGRSATVWRPSFQAPLASSREWSLSSLRRWCALADDPTSGVRMAPTLMVGAVPTSDDLPSQWRIAPEVTAVPGPELPARFDRGLRSRCPVVDVEQHLAWLVGRLRAHGGELTVRRVTALDEAHEVAPVVVNCAGLGARELADDPAVRPLFVQSLVVKNPGLEQVVFEVSSARRWISIVPHGDLVHLGGVRVAGRTDPDPIGEEVSSVLRGCRDVEPGLLDADLVRIDTAVLATRPTTRLETEHRPSGLVVHDYGHGRDDAALVWGAAAEVVRRVTATRA